MIKKFLNVFMCIGLLMQNFIFVIPVMAEEVKEPTIKINGIYQGDNLAEIDEDGNYIIDKYNKVILDFELENINTTDDYYVRFMDETGGGSGGMYNNLQGYREQIYFNNLYYADDEIFTYEIKICDEWECNKQYASETINLKLTYFDDIKDSKIKISDIKQGNKDINAEDTDDYVKYIYLNNKQNISFKLTGENLIDNAEYKISGGGIQNELIYKGSELEQGIDFNFYTNLENAPSSFWVNTSLNDIQIEAPLKYSDGTNTYDYFNILLREDDTLPSYSSKLIYTNFEDTEIKKSDIEYREYFIINSNFHNANNTLSLSVNGNDYIDKDYPVSVEVKKGNSAIYNKELNVNGLLLNNGYEIELEDLVLELNKEEDLNAELYEFYVEVDDIITKQEYKYNSLGKDAYLSSNIFFENGKKNLSAFRGDGNYFYGSGIYDTNKDVFTKYSSIYLRYMGDNFNNNDTYEYILEYGGYIENTEFYARNYEVELKQGQVKGSELNTIGLLFKVDNYKNYENPTYKLTIKKGDEVLYSDAPVLYIVDSPTLANASLKANSKNLYLQTSDLSYIATRNAPIDVVISGLGFEENTEYEFNFCYYKNFADGSWSEDNEKCGTTTFKGKELNNGTAKIHFKDKIDEKASSYNFYVMCDLKDAFLENVAIQGGFEITFVDSKDLFPNLTKYFVDNVSDLIKNISKNTSVEDFTKNVDVKDNGKVKIYDATGTTEITGNVGTGMIARVINEYDENVLDLDVVVKGDVSGDGNISITDLVKVKRHLSQDEDLTGVYEVAGNITDTGEIGITDLVKISRDVAKIQEVQ